MKMVISFKKTIEKGQKKDLMKRNYLITTSIKKMNKYTASLNTLSPIVSHVRNKRRKNVMTQKYSAMIKSTVNSLYGKLPATSK